MRRSPLLTVLFCASLSAALAACTFDDKHEKYPDPADANRSMVQAGRDPTASQAGVVPGFRADDSGSAPSRWATGGMDSTPASSSAAVVAPRK